MPDAPDKRSKSGYIILFVTLVCLTCALVLSLLSSILRPAQEKQVELYQSQQLLIAAKILSHDGHFLIDEKNPAVYDTQKKILVPSEENVKASGDAIFEVQKARIVPHLVNVKGELFTFKQLSIDYETYLQEHAKTGYAHLEYKLVYLIYPNIPPDQIQENQETGFVIPINGYGLWDAIYGYLALKSDGNTIIGTTWYDQKETPGLGANIAEPDWQKDFAGKHIFQEDANGKTDIDTAKLGITVVKTTVKDELGDSPASKSAVDGIAGATVTRTGVQAAYKDSLAPYRAFLVKAYKKAHAGGSQ